MRVAITGHRPNKLGNDYSLTSLLIKIIEKRLTIYMTELKVTQMISGMALGIDTLWAQLAIVNHIPLIAAIPFKGQEVAWSVNSQRIYRTILSKASEIMICDIKQSGSYNWYLSKKETSYMSIKMQNRNEWMVDHCDKLIAVWDGSPGGTANCVKYAQSKMKAEDIIRINPSLIATR